jgi:hypothetical protein
MHTIFLDQLYNDHVTDEGYVVHKLLTYPEIKYLLGEIHKYYTEYIFRTKSLEILMTPISCHMTFQGCDLSVFKKEGMHL